MHVRETRTEPVSVAPGNSLELEVTPFHVRGGWLRRRHEGCQEGLEGRAAVDRGGYLLPASDAAASRDQQAENAGVNDPQVPWICGLPFDGVFDGVFDKQAVEPHA
jgi:hypothetical protein